MKTVITFSILMLLGANAISDTTARLWKIENTSKPQTKFYLLAVTHLGLQTEYDSYLEDIIVPALDSASVFHAEGIGGREDEPYPKCNNHVLDDDGKIIVETTRSRDIDLSTEANEYLHQQLISKGLDDKTTPTDRKTYTQAFINSLDEFELIQNYRLDLDRPKQSSLEVNVPTENSEFFKEDIVSFLIKKKPSLKLIDLDTKYGVRKAYCSLGKDRIKFFTSMTNPERINGHNMDEKGIALNDQLIYFLNKKILPQNSPWLALSDLDNELLCHRTELWAKEIFKLNDGKIHFIAAGIRHVFDNQNGSYKCKGLLSRLQDLGFSTQLVESKK